MKYKTITVFTNHNDADLISSAMFDAGAGGVSILDKQDFLDLIKSDVIWDYVDESVLMQSDEVKVSTICDVDDNEFLKRLETRLEEMKAYGVKYGEIVTGEIDAADYENEWKKYYKPIVTKHVTIVPTWIKYDKKDVERIIRLDPGMAFGTGSHATTRMCLELMDVDGKDVIDVGCGSGILGIAAKIADAKSVYMCDIDEQAVEFARKKRRTQRRGRNHRKSGFVGRRYDGRFHLCQHNGGYSYALFKEHRKTFARKRNDSVVGYH